MSNDVLINIRDTLFSLVDLINAELSETEKEKIVKADKLWEFLRNRETLVSVKDGVEAFPNFKESTISRMFDHFHTGSDPVGCYVDRVKRNGNSTSLYLMTPEGKALEKRPPGLLN